MPDRERIRGRVRSGVMRVATSARFLELRRGRARLVRRLSGGRPAVQYFHQVDDPYSHLAVQKLAALRAAYAIPFEVHLVSAPAAAFRGSAELFDGWALRDAQNVAPAYGASLDATHTPDPAAVGAANALLAPLRGASDFAPQAIACGEQLFAGKVPDGGADIAAGQAAVRAGDTLRRKLGHYLGGMFHFEGEWFWGIDRIRCLERRLLDEGHGTGSGELVVPEPTPVDTTGLAAGAVTLEYFPSLRSPYTAVGHRRVLDLIARSGVSVTLRPVMPMMMRGVPAPQAKQLYIITDAAREARARGVRFERMVDPFGEPVRRAFALFPAAAALGRGMEFVTAYLSAAWAEGIDITQEPGLRRVAAGAGLEWDALQAAARGTDWEALLEDNLQAMLGAGLWGVPSFRVSGGGEPPLACWGQDRIWLVENEIARRAR